MPPRPQILTQTSRTRCFVPGRSHPKPGCPQASFRGAATLSRVARRPRSGAQPHYMGRAGRRARGRLSHLDKKQAFGAERARALRGAIYRAPLAQLLRLSSAERDAQLRHSPSQPEPTQVAGCKARHTDATANYGQLADPHPQPRAQSCPHGIKAGVPTCVWACDKTSDSYPALRGQRPATHRACPAAAAR